MIEDILKILRGKKLLLLGFGREGKASYELIRRYLPDQPLTIADQQSQDLSQLHLVEGIFGPDYQEHLADYDLILKSPGIVLAHPEEVRDKITSQTELFLRAFRDQVIGITGTKGKSTTTSLIYHVLKENHPDCLLMGNIGIPAFSLAEQVTPDTLIVYELSCHQLEYISVSPHAAVLLNLFEEHLDHYGTREAYFNAKRNICRFQQPGDLYFCNLLQKDDVQPLAARQFTLCQGAPADFWLEGRVLHHPDGSLTLPVGCCPLEGEHNLYNIMTAYAVTRAFGVSDEAFLKAIATFSPLPHRLHRVGTFRGVTYYDDSISTACETAIQAMESLKQQGVGSLLLGGMDRGIDYTSLCQYLVAAPPDHLILMPDSGMRIGDMLEQMGYSAPMHRVSGLEEAVRLASEVTPAGKVCLLSPASASYGFFKNFEERGDRFIQLVKEVTGC